MVHQFQPIKVNQENLKKLVITLIISICLLLSTNISYASSISLTTYGDALPSNTTVQNLIRNASNYDSFYNSDYVVLRTNQYEYFILWGNDIEVYDNTFGGVDLEYLRYYKDSYDDDYKYIYSKADSLHVTKTYEVTSNVSNLGLRSDLADEFTLNYYILISISFIVGISAFMAFKIGRWQK